MTVKWYIVPQGIMTSKSNQYISLVGALLAIIALTASLLMGSDNGLRAVDFAIIGAVTIGIIIIITSILMKQRTFGLSEAQHFTITFVEGYFYYRSGEDKIVILPSAISKVNHTKPRGGYVKVQLELDASKMYTLEEKNIKSLQFKMKEEEFNKFNMFVEDTL